MTFSAAIDREAVRGALLDAATVIPSAGAARRAKVAITDCLAVALAGSADPTSVAVRAGLSRVDGAGDAIVWGTSERRSLGSAVFANAVAAHVLGWDDYTQPMFGHCTAVLLPVCAGLADATGASGLAVLEAFVAGYEVNGRLGEVLASQHYDLGWHPTSTIGTIGAAAAAARLLRLDRDQTWHAMGIAASAAAGFQGNFGAMTKSLHAGQAARSGLAAANLASVGVTANADWLLSLTGYLRLMGVGDLQQAAGTLLAVRGDGLVIEGPRGLILKPYCCCGSAQPMIRAIVELMEGNDLSAHDVEAVEVHVDPAVTALLTYDQPQDPFQARYSLPYLAAIALLDRAAGPMQFTPQSMRRADVAAAMKRIRYADDLVSPPTARYRADVTLRARTDVLHTVMDVPEGHPSAPMSDVTRRRKFDQGAGVVLHRTSADRLYGYLEDVERCPRWSVLSACLVT